MSQPFNIEVIIDNEYYNIIVVATHHPYYKGRRDGKYGPPIEPDEPEHWEIESINFEDGTEVPEDAVNINLLYEEIARQVAEQELEDYNDLHDFYY